MGIMTEPDTAPPAASPPAAPVPRKFWSLRLPGPRERKRLLLIFLIALLLVSFDVAPLWRTLWRWHVYGFFNCATMKDAEGRKREAWRWVEGRAIRVYGAPEVRASAVEQVAEGVRDLLRDAGLDFTVEVRPMPPEVLEAYTACLHTRGNFSYVAFEKLERRLIALRDGDPHADVIVIKARIGEVHWAHGMATFTSGLAVVRYDMAAPEIGKHEAGHLMGYMRHDSQPILVFGYPWEGWPWRRNTLMMLRGTRPDLSPRARDALRCFWQGMESKTGRKYLLPLAGE
jgi:hypothetical protein